MTEESRDLLERHFKPGTALHDMLARATRNEISGVAVYVVQCEREQAQALLEMARNHCPPAVTDIEHAISAATAS